MTGHFFHTLRPRSENTGLHFFWKKRKPKIGLFSKLFYTHYVQPNDDGGIVFDKQSAKLSGSASLLIDGVCFKAGPPKKVKESVTKT